MSTLHVPVSDMLATVKSREVQRGMLAAMRDDLAEAAKHFLAAAHLELVLADDYEAGGEIELAIRARISAGSCFWRAGEVETGRRILDEIASSDPARDAEIRDVLSELALGPGTTHDTTNG